MAPDLKTHDTADVVTDMQDIPDLEEEIQEDTKIAAAPNVMSQKIQALSELDHEIMFQLRTATVDGLDLSLLTSALTPQEKVVDPDVTWDFESIFTQVNSEMQAELEPEGGGADGDDKEGDDEEKASSAAAHVRASHK